ncbi:hypothetical protein MMC30_005679 [Trapelia coarctata]|nr:hypothetical protein [Trapelia coarctata]
MAEISYRKKASLADLFLSLPGELQLDVLLHLDKETVAALRKTSRAFYNVAQVHQAPLVRNLIRSYELCGHHQKSASRLYSGPVSFEYYYHLHRREMLLRKLAGLMADIVEIDILKRVIPHRPRKITPRTVRVEHFYLILKHILFVLENHRDSLPSFATTEVSQPSEAGNGETVHRCSLRCGFDIVLMLWYFDHNVGRRLRARVGNDPLMERAKIYVLYEFERFAKKLVAQIDRAELAALRDRWPISTAGSLNSPRPDTQVQDQAQNTVTTDRLAMVDYCALSHAPAYVTAGMISFFTHHQKNKGSLLETEIKTYADFREAPQTWFLWGGLVKWIKR